MINNYVKLFFKYIFCSKFIEPNLSPKRFERFKIKVYTATRVDKYQLQYY